MKGTLAVIVGIASLIVFLVGGYMVGQSHPKAEGQSFHGGAAQ